MDKIFLKNLRLKTRIGLFDWEKQIDQIINIDLEAGFDISKAAKTDDVKHSLDYKTISNKIKEYVKSNDHELIEIPTHQIFLKYYKLIKKLREIYCEREYSQV